MIYSLTLTSVINGSYLGHVRFEDDGGGQGFSSYEDIDDLDLAQINQIMETMDDRVLFLDPIRDPDEYLWNLIQLGNELSKLKLFGVQWSPAPPIDLEAPFSLDYPYESGPDEWIDGLVAEEPPE